MKRFNFRYLKRAHWELSLCLMLLLGSSLPSWAVESQQASSLKVPKAIQAEHEKLHVDLEAALRSGGQTAKEAERLKAVLEPHFVKEESYALPILSVLPALAQWQKDFQGSQVIQLAEKLRVELPEMLSEHHRIESALTALRQAAKKEQKINVVAFCDRLEQHARMEEDILYPAALVAGDYIRLKELDTIDASRSKKALAK